jgi:cell wall-associated NlpC family hydrolase
VKVSWTAQYIGLPFLAGGRDRDGLDCWGLVSLVYREQLGVALDDLSGLYLDDCAVKDIAPLIARQAEGPQWRKVERDAVQPFDVLVFRRGALAAHVGLVIDRKYFLHVNDDQVLSCRERYTEGLWSRLLIAAYRHASRS